MLPDPTPADTIRLAELINRARSHTITDEERKQQIVSFAYGNLHMENEAITREDVERAVEELYGE